MFGPFSSFSGCSCKLAMAVPFFDDDPEDHVHRQQHHQNLPLQNPAEYEDDDPPSGRVDVSDVSSTCNEDDTDVA